MSNPLYENKEHLGAYKIQDFICFLASKIPENKKIELDKVYDILEFLLEINNKQIDISGFPSLILKMAYWRRVITEKLFLSEMKRISYDGNLGLEIKEAIGLFNGTKDICFDNIRSVLKEELEKELNNRLSPDTNDNKSHSGVWIPLVDESNFVWFSQYLYNNDNNILFHFMTKECNLPEIRGESYKLGKEVANRLTGYSKTNVKLIVTGIYDEDSEEIFPVDQDKFELKIGASLGFGYDYIIVPRENYEKSDLCKKTNNIISLSNLEELNEMIHKLSMKSIRLDKIIKLNQNDNIYETIKDSIEQSKKNIKSNFNINNNDFKEREKEAKNLFINQKYFEAYYAYSKLMEDFSDVLNNNSKDYLRVLLNKIKSENSLFKSEKKEYKEVLKIDLEKYKNVLSSTNDYGNSTLVIEFFEIATMFFLKLAYDEGFQESFKFIKPYYESCAIKIFNKNDLEKKWLNCLSDCRFIFSENGRSNLLLDHCELLNKDFSEILGNDEKVKLLDLIAETEYFSFGIEIDNIKYERIINYLDKAINLKPGDIFAKQLRKRVKEMKVNDSQIRRFKHDSNSKLGSLKIKIANLGENANLPEEMYRQLDNINLDIESLIGIHDVAIDMKITKNDWVTNDIADYLEKYFKANNKVFSFSQPIGKKRVFEYCERYLSVVLDNLIKNTEEAYDKLGTEPSECKIEITVNYDDLSVIFRDFAGGIAPEIKDKLFEEHASTKEEVACNCGIGLYQAKKAMKLQDNSYDIKLLDPQPDKGAAFVLVFKGE